MHQPVRSDSDSWLLGGESSRESPCRLALRTGRLAPGRLAETWTSPYTLNRGSAAPDCSVFSLLIRCGSVLSLSPDVIFVALAVLRLAFLRSQAAPVRNSKLGYALLVPKGVAALFVVATTIASLVYSHRGHVLIAAPIVQILSAVSGKRVISLGSELTKYLEVAAGYPRHCRTLQIRHPQYTHHCLRFLQGRFHCCNYAIILNDWRLSFDHPGTPTRNCSILSSLTYRAAGQTLCFGQHGLFPLNPLNILFNGSQHRLFPEYPPRASYPGPSTFG